MRFPTSKPTIVLFSLTAACALSVASFLLVNPPPSSAAEPGSKDDPLATVGYVERFAQYNSVTLPARQSLRVGVGTEFVLVEAGGSTVRTTEFKPLHDELVDMTEGAPVLVEELNEYHHYLNASGHDIFFRFESETTLFIRGTWK